MTRIRKPKTALQREITVRFDRRGYGRAQGNHAGKVVTSWSGHPEPELGQTWRCEVLTQWESGMLVRPLALA